MVQEKIQIHNRNVEVRLKTLENWDTSKENREDIKLFLRDLGLGKVNRGFKITDSRQLRYLDALKPVFLYLKKSLNELALKDMEELDLALSKDEIKRFDGKPYLEDTKKHIKKLFKIYLKWKFKDNPAKFAELTSWLDTRTTHIKTPEYMPEDEVVMLFKACKSNEERFLIAILFDIGARAEEFHNIRFEDILAPTESHNYYRITLKEEYSKTKGRTVGLYWKHSTDAIKDYLAERKKQGVKQTDAVFNNTYDAVRMFLARLGKKILNKRVHCHLFRHSSATYYANKLNRQELCYRYGWAFSSDMPDVYISRSGMVERQVEEKFTKTDLEELNQKILKQEQGFKLLQEKFETSEKQNKLVSEKIEGFLNILKKDKRNLVEFVKSNQKELEKLYAS